MADGFRSQNWQRALITLTGTVVLATVVFCLYWARPVFIPIAIAVFLSFVLSPLVRALEKLKIGRVGAVVLVLSLALLLSIGVGTVLVTQASEFATELPSYSHNITGKLKVVLDFSKSSISTEMRRLIDEVSETWQPRPAEKNEPTREDMAGGATSKASKPIPVTVRPEGTAWLTSLSSLFEPVFSFLAQAGFAVVLIVFMLCRREDLRNRFLWLVGHGRLTTTTRAVDDAAQRLTRYLFAQFILNVSFGLVLGIGLALLGIKHAFLWAFVAGLLRYVPYLGVPLAASFPIALSLIQFPGWLTPLLVVGLIAVLEIVTSQVIEPMLFGRSGGVSEVTLLVAAALSAFLWGPVGLILAMPMTVCLVVLGEYVPGLQFVAVLLGDKPALPPATVLYQRLTARDHDEALRITLEFAEKKDPELVFDELLLPVLCNARQEIDRNELVQADVDTMLQALREILEELKDKVMEKENPPISVPEGRGLILGISARDELDQLALEMLGTILDPDKWELEIAPVNLLASEAVPYVTEREPAIVCISAVAPGGRAHTRYLCKRLRGKDADLSILFGNWGGANEGDNLSADLQGPGVTQVETRFLEAREHLRAWRPILAADQQKTKRESATAKTLAEAPT